MHDQQGIILFDQFGTKLKSIPLDTPSIVLQLSENSLIYSDKGQLMSYQMNLNAFQKENNLCPQNAVKAYFSEEKCWHLDQETLYFPQWTFQHILVGLITAVIFEAFGQKFSDI